VNTIQSNKGLKKIGSQLSLLATFAVFVICMYPVVKTPLIADDFGIALGQSFRVNQTWLDQWDLAWSTIFSGTHFNLIGNFIAMLWIKLWISISIGFDLDLHVGFWILKFLVMCFTAFSIAWFAAKHFLFSFKNSVIASLLLFSTMIQIHSPWSNDPVTNFTLAGFFVAPFALLAISTYIRFYEQQSVKALLTTFSASLLALLIYEINFAIVGFQVAFLFAHLFLTRFSSTEKERRSLIFLLSPTIFLTITVFLLRSFAANDSANYGGSSIALTWRTLTTFIYNLGSSLPFVAFPKSIPYVNGNSFSTLNLIIVATFIFLLSYVLSQVLLKRKMIRVELEKANQISSAAISIGILFWVFCGVGIQSITSKIQAETHSLGSVYTFYAVSYVGVTLLILANLRFAFKRDQMLFFLSLILIAFSALQLQVNLGLKVWLNQNLKPNLNLVSLATGQSSRDERCDALQVWLAGPWPEYYESETVIGLDTYSMIENNEKFCPDIK
jgi:hypothetical protein